MSSRGKKKTTMAKLSREAKLRERRFEKAARKEARKDAAASPATDVLDPDASDFLDPDVDRVQELITPPHAD